MGGGQASPALFDDGCARHAISAAAARFAARYPVVWHVIEGEGAGPWLATTGLLPAAELLRRAGITADGRNRDDFRRVRFDGGAVALLRPQRMPDIALTPTLGGAFRGRPDAWRQLIDLHVFFWTDPVRRDRFLEACMRLRATSRSAGDTIPPVILALDTAALLGRHGEHAFLARFNAGSTVRGGARVRRDETTLVPLSQYQSGSVAELALRCRFGCSVGSAARQSSLDRPSVAKAETDEATNSLP